MCNILCTVSPQVHTINVHRGLCCILRLQRLKGSGVVISLIFSVTVFSFTLNIMCRFCSLDCSRAEMDGYSHPPPIPHTHTLLPYPHHCITKFPRYKQRAFFLLQKSQIQISPRYIIQSVFKFQHE